jgi:hypothetical protein
MHRGGVEVYPYSFMNSVVETGRWSAPRPNRFSPGNDTLPIAQETGRAAGPVRMFAKNQAPNRI